MTRDDEPRDAQTRRFAATEVTFGLRGRILMTVVLLLPFTLFGVSFVAFGVIGFVCWTPLFVRGVRDVWRRSDRLLARRDGTQRGHAVIRPDDVAIVTTSWDDENRPPRRW